MNDTEELHSFCGDKDYMGIHIDILLSTIVLYKYWQLWLGWCYYYGLHSTHLLMSELVEHQLTIWNRIFILLLCLIVIQSHHAQFSQPVSLCLVRVMSHRGGSWSSRLNRKGQNHTTFFVLRG